MTLQLPCIAEISKWSLKYHKSKRQNPGGNEMDKPVDIVAPELIMTTPGMITARLDRLPMTRHMWVLLTLFALGGFFELYDLFFTGYIAPGLFKDNLLTPTTTSFFSMTGLAGFLASVFIG